MQIMVPKMTELARTQNSENARHLLASQHGAESTKAMVAADTREVHAKKDAQRAGLRVRDEGGGRGGNGGRQNRERKKRNPFEDDSHIDIKL